MNTTVSPVVFSFTTELKLYDFEELTVYQIFPNAESVTMISKDYDEIGAVASAAQEFCTAIMRFANTTVKDERYKIIAEVNPEITGKPGLTDDWEHNEVSKIWILAHSGPIESVRNVDTAIALTTITKDRGAETSYLN